ncbi:MAG: GNAT family N-acetyltransferase [Terasakiella sp.]|uniref:GNAT family N-acetyltransferase n=1 Tax=unclassified Terasakiella TaxID=2614952 RepID=UPI003B00A826
MSLTFTRVQKDKDLDQFFELVEQYRVELNENVCFPAYEKERMTYGADKTFIFLAKKDGHICGCIAYRPKTDAVYEMKRLYVLPLYRQQKIADQLLMHTLNFLRENHIQKIELETLKRLGPALSFYQKHGFQIDENAQHTKHEDIVPMGLTLGK